MKKLCKNNELWSKIIVPVAQVAVIVSLVLAFVCPVSCRMSDSESESDVHISEGDYAAPVLSSYVLTGEKNIRLVFSKKVSVAHLSLTPAVEIDSVSYGNPDDEQCCADVVFSSALEIGCAYALYGEATDDSGNSLTFSVPFTGYNAEVPGIEIVRMRIKYQGERNGDGKFYNEFVEVRALTDGNLAGLELFSVSDGECKKYVFPAVRVTKGEIVAVHMRSAGSGCIDELTDDLNLSSAFDSVDGVRDLWSENTTSCLNDSTDIVVLRNSFDGSLVDIVPYAKTGTAQWKTDAFVSALETAVEKELWSPDSAVGSAVNADGSSHSKIFVKIQAGHSADCWTVSNAGTVYSLSDTSAGNQSAGTETPSPSESGDESQTGNDDGGTEDATDEDDGSGIARLEITEIKAVHKNDEGTYYNEFVELRALSAGTLSGLEIFSVNDGESKKYVFPSIMVSKGEIVVVHLRSVGEGCISELGDDLDVSTAFGSAAGVRDLWAENTGASLGDERDVVVLRRTSGGLLVDVVPYAKSTAENWKKDTFVSMLDSAVSKKLWSPDSSITSAVNAGKLTSTRSLIKIKSGHSADCWTVSDTNKSTPGTVDF